MTRTSSASAIDTAAHPCYICDDAGKPLHQQGALMKLRYLGSVVLIAILLAATGPPTLAADEQATPIRPGAVVVEFYNATDYRGHLLGLRATAAVWKSLSGLDGLQVTPLPPVLAASEELDITAPIAAGCQQALGHRFGTALIFSGAVEDCRIDAKSGKVSVTLKVIGIDQITGQPVASVICTGRAQRGDGPARATDAIVDEALSDAAAAVGAELAGIPAGRAPVVEVADERVVLDTAGVSLPDEAKLLIYRGTTDRSGDRQLVAVAIISSSGDEHTTARLLGTSNHVYTGDIAVAIPAPSMPPGR